MTILRAALIGIALGCIGVYVWRGSAAPRDAATPASLTPDIVLVTIDTLRADRIGRRLTPAIDAFAGRGVRFTNARTPVPLTLPAHVSMMTGLLPATHGVRENGIVFAPQGGTVARALKGAGYATAAFVGAYVLDSRFGLADGFDRYDDRVPRDPERAERLEAERRGGEVVDGALDWLASAPSPYFLWVHLYDPHAPYDPPREYLARGGGHPYDGEVAYADAQVGRILDATRDRGRTLIVLAGDHGEGLGDHGERTHGMLAYDTTLRVPLVIAGADVEPRTFAAPVSLIDVAPTLLRAAGLQPSADVQGLNLLASLPDDRDVFAETQYPRAAGWHALAAIAGDRWKLVLSSEPELYDLRADPDERANVAASRDAIVHGMAARLRRLEAAAPAASPAIDAATAERLRALGYVSGAAAGTAANPQAVNPARVIAAWTAFESALAQLNAGEPARALPALKELAARFPASPMFASTYARALLDAGDAGAALPVYRAAAARNPRDAALFHDLAAAARAAGDRAEAMRAEQAALALDANNPAARNGLGLLHADAGNNREAAQAFERAAAADPANASYWTNLGNAKRSLGDAPGAERAYQRALDVEADHADALNGLGVMLVQTGRAADAVSYLERAVARDPDFHEARLNLGIAHQERGDRESAIRVYRDVLRRAPRSAARERRAASDLLRRLLG